MTKHNPALPLRALCPSQEPTLPLSFFPHTTTSQRCHPHHPETGAAHAHPHANQNHQEASAGKTKAHAQTTPSPATLMTATATMLHLLAVTHRPAIEIEIDSVIAHPDVMAVEMAIVLDRRGETIEIVTEMEGTEDARLDVMEEIGMRGKRRGRKIGPRTRRRRRSPRLLLRPVARSL